MYFHNPPLKFFEWGRKFSIFLSGWQKIKKNSTSGDIIVISLVLQLDLTHKIKTRQRTMDGQLPSQGWVPNFQNLQEEIVLQPYQKEVYYRLWIGYLDLTHKIKTSLQSMVTHISLDGHPLSKILSAIIRNTATHFPKDYHPKSGQAWLPTNLTKHRVWL